MVRVVLDTNCLISSVSRRSRYYPIWKAFVDKKFILCVTTEILEEYEEILSQKTNATIAENILTAIINRSNVEFLDVFYRFRLIVADPTDDKFADCAIKAGVGYLVTNDRHFNVLKGTPFPPVNIVTIEEFLKIVQE